MGLAGLVRSELNSTATRFDLLNAAPPSHQRTIIWITWSIEAFTVGTFTTIFFLGILSSPKTRRRSFNLYVLSITAPDTLFSFGCSITCLLNALKGQYISEWMCSFQTFYTIFAFTANAWLNAVVVRQVHKMLQSCSRREKYEPPRRRTVLYHALGGYAYSMVIASMTLWNTPVHRHSDARGLACLPLEFDWKSSLFFWGVFLWLMIGIPLIYVVYVWIDVKRRRLLPESDGRTRSVAIFFARITAVFVIMWLPTIVSIFFGGSLSTVWGAFIGGVWSHLQPIVSAGVAMFKKDIGTAVWNFVCCRGWWRDCWGDENDNGGDGRDGGANGGGRRGRRRRRRRSNGGLAGVSSAGAGITGDEEEGDSSTSETFQEQPSSTRRALSGRRSSVFGSFLDWAQENDIEEGSTS